MIRIFTADNRLVVHAEHGDLARVMKANLPFGVSNLIPRKVRLFLLPMK